jgi:hypothetical protein
MDSLTLNTWSQHTNPYSLVFNLIKSKIYENLFKMLCYYENTLPPQFAMSDFWLPKTERMQTWSVMYHDDAKKCRWTCLGDSLIGLILQIQDLE